MANTSWNPSDKTGTVTLSGLNLIATSTAANAWVRTVDRQITGKFYWEVTMTTWLNASTGIGMANQGSIPSAFNAPGLVSVFNNGQIWSNGTSQGTLLAASTSGQLIGFALDAGASLAWFRRGAAGSWNGNAAANPATGSGGLSIPAVGGGGIPAYPACTFGASADAANANFGDSGFSGTVPGGFTGGFTSGASIGTNVIATQIAIEQWASVAAAVPGASQAYVMVLA